MIIVNGVEVPIYGFMHVAQLNHWRTVLSSQFASIHDSGLLSVTDRIFVGLLGHELDLDVPVFFGEKLEVLFQYENMVLFEFPTLEMLQNTVKLRESCYVWYIHTKGVSSLVSIRKENWRRAMEFVVLLQWRRCVEALETHDVAGPFYFSRDRADIFAGNFWWARGDYVVKLPRVNYCSTDRFDAENWVCRASPRVKFWGGKELWEKVAVRNECGITEED